MRAARRQLVAVPCIALAALAAACGGAGPSASQSTRSSHPGRSAPPTETPPTNRLPPTSGAAALDAVDWGSVTVPGDVCPDRTAPVRLAKGKASIPAPRHVHAPAGLTVAEGPHAVGDLYGPGRDVAAVNVWCSAARGSAASELENSWVVFADAGGTPRAIATLLPQQPASARKGLHVPYFDSGPGGIAIAPGTVTVKELWYAPKDRTCCPSQHVTTVWHAHGASFSAYTGIGT